MLVYRLHGSAAAAMLVEGEICCDHRYKNLYDRQPQHGLFDTTYKHVSTAHNAGYVFCSVRHTGGGLD